MPIEKIKQLLQEKSDEIIRQEKAHAEALEMARLELEEKKKQQNEAKEKRRLFVVEQTQKILRGSGVLDNLLRIENELLDGNVTEHDLFYKPDDGKAVLVWGKNFRYSDHGHVVSANYGSFGYSTIEAVVDPDGETLTIIGNENYKFNNQEWQNVGAVESALAKSYVYPKHESGISEPIYTHRDSGDDMGCCCGAN